MNPKINASQATKVIIGLMLVAAFTFSVSGLNKPSVAQSQTLSLGGKSFYFDDYVCVSTTGAIAGNPTHGVMKDLPCRHNAMTNNGLNFVIGVLNGSYPTGNSGVKYVAIGNTSQAGGIAATDTKLGQEDIDSACGLINASGTVFPLNTAVGTMNVTKTFTNACGSTVINSTALYNSSYSLNTIVVPIDFVEATFTSATLAANDQINVTWGLQVTG